MNLKELKSIDPHYIVAAIIAIIGCLYVAIVSLGGIKEAKATEPLVPVINTDVSPNNNIDSNARKIDMVDSSAVEEPVQKMVTLLTVDGVFLGDVCFEANSDSVFMSYGWRGLASKALHHANINKQLDDIKIDISDNCDLAIIARIKLNPNPEAITAKSNISSILY